MVRPIHPYEGTHGIPQNSQTREQKEKLFELQFQTAVIGDFIAVTGQNNNPSLQGQVDKLKGGIAKGEDPDQLASALNQLTNQVNADVTSQNQPPFPIFNFSKNGGGAQAVTHFAISLEKLLKSAAEKNDPNWSADPKIFKELSLLIRNAHQMTTEECYNSLNRIVEEINQAFSAAHRLPKFPAR